MYPIHKRRSRRSSRSSTEYIVTKAAQGSKKFLKQLRSYYPDSFIFYKPDIGLLIFWNNYIKPVQVLPTKIQQIAAYIELFGPSAQIYKDKDLSLIHI